MTSNSYGDGSTRGFDKVPPDVYQPDPAQPDTHLRRHHRQADRSATAKHGLDSRTVRSARTDRLPTRHRPCRFRPARCPRAHGSTSRCSAVRCIAGGSRCSAWSWSVPLAVIMMGMAIVPVLVAGLITGAPDLVEYTVRTTSDIANLGPIGFIYLNLTLIVLIPASGLSIWIAHGIRPGYLSSVAGGIRWRWLLRCVAVILPLWALYTLLGVLVEPFTSPPGSLGGAAGHRAAPDAAAGSGEEYFFRGWIMQNVGAWFARPMVGLVVSLAVSAAAFSTAHLSPDPWVLGTIACLAVLQGWRRGGPVGWKPALRCTQSTTC